MSKKRGTHFVSHNGDYRDYQTWSKKFPIDKHYDVVLKDELKGLVHQELIDKSNVGIVITENISGCSIYLTILNRKDPGGRSGSQIDEHPVINVFNHSASTCMKLYIEHGTWEGRTITTTDRETWDHISGSEVFNYSSLAQIPEKKSGDISELTPSSKVKAYKTALEELINPTRKDH